MATKLNGKGVVMGNGSVVKTWGYAANVEQKREVKYSQFKEYASFYVSMIALAVSAAALAVFFVAVL